MTAAEPGLQTPLAALSPARVPPALGASKQQPLYRTGRAPPSPEQPLALTWPAADGAQAQPPERRWVQQDRGALCQNLLPRNVLPTACVLGRTHPE